MDNTKEVKILTPVGMLGYSFSEDLFWDAVEAGVDAIILDSGSTDSGPSKLALGHTSATRAAYERDLGILVAACHYHKVPVLIGSAGGDGSNAHVALLKEIVCEAIAKNGYRPMKVITIEAEIPKAVVQSKFDAGLVGPCGRAVPGLTQADVDDAVRAVAQMGHEPWLRAMRENPDFDVVIAGRSYDPAPYAAFCLLRGLSDLGLAYHMGKIMECGGQCAVPKSIEALAVVREGSFDIRPLNPSSCCTPLSVAAHTLYEKTRPDLLAGPGGVLDVSLAKFEPLDDGRSVRVTGARFVPAGEGGYTVKLEGARLRGHMAMVFGGVRDPIMIGQLDALVPMLKERLRTVFPFEFDLLVRTYGKDPLVPRLSDSATQQAFPTEVGILAKVLAATEEQARAVANLAKVYLIHAPYPGQVATAGNFMMPYAPSDLYLGQAAEFCLYHLMQVDDPTEMFPIFCETVSAPEVEGGARANGVRPSKPAQNGTSTSALDTLAKQAAADIFAHAAKRPPLRLSPPPAEGFVHLASLAHVLRSKNAGPFECTVDILFPDRASYGRAKAAGILNKEEVMRLYGIGDPDDVLACLWWEPALAFKVTMKRAVSSGSFADDDTHGSGAHVPLMYLQVPAE